MAGRLTLTRRFRRLFIIVVLTICILITLHNLNRKYLSRILALPRKLYEAVGNPIIDLIFTTHHLAVIVPFRDRYQALEEFVPYIHRFLLRKGISHEIFVVNQVDSYRFNRAGLVNAGYLYASKSKDGQNQNEKSVDFDYIAMHDVDLLPLNDDLPYSYPGRGSVIRVAAPGLHPMYSFPGFIGGILLVTFHDYLKVNGMTNRCWGWGMEDSDFYFRLRHYKIGVNSPTGIKTGWSDTFRHIHNRTEKRRDKEECYDQFHKTKLRDKLTGVDNLNYTLESASKIIIGGTSFTFLNVSLHCDKKLTPWCDCSEVKSDITEATSF